MKQDHGGPPHVAFLSLRLGSRTRATSEVGNPPPPESESYKEEEAAGPSIDSEIYLCDCCIPGSLSTDYGWVQTLLFLGCVGSTQSPRHCTAQETSPWGHKNTVAPRKLAPSPFCTGCWGVEAGSEDGNLHLVLSTRVNEMLVRTLLPFSESSLTLC